MTEIIRSLQNPRVKQALRLRDRKGRQRQSRIIIDGIRETRRALEAEIDALEIFVCESMLPLEVWEQLQPALAARALEATPVTRDVFAKLAFGSRQEGVVLVAAQPQLPLQQLCVADNALIVVLETVEKPGNLGAIIRTADAAGASSVIVADGGTDLYNPNAIRASLGAIFHMPVCAAPVEDVLSWLVAHEMAIYAARVDATTTYTQADFRPKCAVVLGSESNGLTAAWNVAEVTPIALPMCGIVDSLNVAATAAVLLYEATRQRRA